MRWRCCVWDSGPLDWRSCTAPCCAILTIRRLRQRSKMRSRKLLCTPYPNGRTKCSERAASTEQPPAQDLSTGTGFPWARVPPFALGPPQIGRNSVWWFIPCESYGPAVYGVAVANRASQQGCGSEFRVRWRNIYDIKYSINNRSRLPEHD